jgi:hypothetical protein
MKKHTAKSYPVPDLGHFLNFNLFLIIFKNNPWQTLFALGDPFGRARQRDAAASLCRATCSGAAEVPRWPAAARAPGVGQGLPHHMRQRSSLAAPPCLGRQRRVNRVRAAPFLPPPPFLPLPEPACIRRRRRPAHPQIQRFVVGIVWEIDPYILGKVLPLFNLRLST